MRFRWIGVLLLAITASSAHATCPPLTAANALITFSGSESACSHMHPYCTQGDAVTFRVQPFRYDFRCGPHSFAWSFSDGFTFTSTGPSITRVITSPHPWDVTVVVTNGRDSVRLSQHIVTNVIIERWPMIVDHLSRRTFRFMTTWTGDITWDFGDGTTATGREVVHEFGNAPRTYTVTVRSGAASYEQPIHVPGDRRRAARH